MSSHIFQTAQALSLEIQKNPTKFQYTGSPGRAEFWKSFSTLSVCVENEDASASNSTATVPGFVICKNCKTVMRFDNKLTGSSHIKRHAETCSQPQPLIQQSLPFVKKMKLNDAEKLAIKNAQLDFCVRDYHSFNALEADGLCGLLQTVANIAAKHGHCNVKDFLYKRNTISSFCKSKAKEVKLKLKNDLIEPQNADSLAVTVDMWSDDYKHSSYLDMHAFWINQNFDLKHHLLAVRHFGTERHTADNIVQVMQDIFLEYDIDPTNVTATTDHAANIVAAFEKMDRSGRLDCFAHRLHTCFTTMWSRACNLSPELLEYDSAAAALVKYCNHASGLQEQLPVTVKKGSSTRRWQGLCDRAHSINESYDTFMRILAEPHRDRAILVASVNRRLNENLLGFLKPFGNLFKALQFNSKPTIQYVVLTYYKAVDLAQPLESDSKEIGILKTQFRDIVDRTLFESLKAHHWLATFLDPDFKKFDFVPDRSRSDILFKSRLLSDIDKWIIQHMEHATQYASASLHRGSPPQRRARVEISDDSDPFSDFRNGRNVLSTPDNMAEDGMISSADRESLNKVHYRTFLIINISIFSKIVVMLLTEIYWGSCLSISQNLRMSLN